MPAAYSLLFAKGVTIRTYNKDIFIMFLGFAFGSILLFIPPMQGWYYWIIPFFAYFYSKEKKSLAVLFFGLQIFYLLYFLLCKDSDYLEVFQLVYPRISALSSVHEFMAIRGVGIERASNIAFTLLQTTLFLNCLWIYRTGITSYSKHKIASQPFLIGIGGNSGVGKTTLANAIKEIFQAKNTTIIRGDDMHKWERNHKKWQDHRRIW